jgi:hypothetical protein
LANKPSQTVIQERFRMAKIDDLIPNAKEIQKQAALKEAQKADEHAKRLAAAEAEKQALTDRLNKPSGLTEEEKVQLASTVIQRAVRNGLSEVQVYRFPNSLCTDKGRAINQMEKGWEKTLSGIPKEIYQLWSDYLQPRGYRISYQIVDFPGGMPGDIAITIAWDG